MAPRKEKKLDTPSEPSVEFEKLVRIVSVLASEVEKLGAEVDALREELAAVKSEAIRKQGKSIQKVEEFNGEVIPDQNDNMRMSYADKIISARNACAILPPNLIVDGRHTAKNVGAICGFVVDDEMLDEVYSTFKHEVF